jgi:HSP20 family protein
MYPMYYGTRMMPRRGWQWDDRRDVAYQPLPVDVAEKGDGYSIRLSVPGINTEQIQVVVQGDTVTIRAERPEKDSDGTQLLRERYTGRLGRTLTLPAELDPEKTEATLEDGVLEIRVTKTESVQSKTIPIQRK